MGTPNERMKMCYRAIEVGMERALELLRPGTLPSRLYAEVIAAVEKAGSRITPDNPISAATASASRPGIIPSSANR